MKIEINLDLSPAQKNFARWGLVSGVAIAAIGLGIAFAAPIETGWIVKDAPVSAASLSGNLKGLQQQITALQDTHGSWQVYSPDMKWTDGAVQTAITTGAQTHKGIFRREGDSVHVRLRTDFTQSPAANGGQSFAWALPPNVSIDPTKMNKTQIIGTAWVYMGSQSHSCVAVASYWGGTSLGAFCEGVGAAVQPGVPATIVASSSIEIDAVIPVIGW